MSETQGLDSSAEAKFVYGEHIFIRPHNDFKWTVTYIEGVVEGKPVLAMPEPYLQSMLIEAESFECCTNPDGRYQFFEASIEQMRLEKPAYVTLSKPRNVVVESDCREKKRLVVNILATIQEETGTKMLHAIVHDLSPTGLALTHRGTLAPQTALTVTLHMPVRNFFKNNVKMTGDIVWSRVNNGCTSLGISANEKSTENGRLLHFFHDYHLNA